MKRAIVTLSDQIEAPLRAVDRKNTITGNTLSGKM